MNQNTLQRALHDAQSGKLDTAIASLRTLLRGQPKNTDAMQLLGLLLTQCGQTELAVVQLKRAVALAPRSAGYRNNLGNALRGLGKHAEAAKQYEEAIAIDPSYFRAFLGLALARTELFDSAGAAEICRRGLAIRPDWPEMIICAAAAYEAADQLDEALVLVRESLSRSRSNPILLSKLAFILNYLFSTPNLIVSSESAFFLVTSKRIRWPTLQRRYFVRVELMTPSSFSRRFPCLKANL